MKPPITGSKTTKRFILVGEVEEQCFTRIASGRSPILFCLQRPLYKTFFLNYSKERD